MTGYKHYVYKISFETGHVYFGVRSCKCSPEEDVYMGSPVTHKDYWERYEPKKTILKEFDTREEAEEAEKFLINWQWESTDDGKFWSLNATIAGVKFNNFGTVGKGRNYLFISPTGQIFEGNNIKRFCEEHNLDGAHMLGVLNGTTTSHKGWTSNFENYLRLKYFNRVEYRQTIKVELIDKNFNVYEVWNRNQFAKKHGLSTAHLSQVCNGIRNETEDFFLNTKENIDKLKKDKATFPVTLIHESGEEVILNNRKEISTFRAIQGFQKTSQIWKVINGKYKKARGWSLKENK